MNAMTNNASSCELYVRHTSRRGLLRFLDVIRKRYQGTMEVSRYVEDGEQEFFRYLHGYPETELVPESVVVTLNSTTCSGVNEDYLQGLLSGICLMIED